MDNRTAGHYGTDVAVTEEEDEEEEDGEGEEELWTEQNGHLS